MTARRRQFRMPVSRYGLVTRDRTTTLCEILDITDQGLHFSTDLLREDTVRIECHLDTDCNIQCGLVITHAEPPRFGGRMTFGLPEPQQQLTFFTQRLITSSMAEL
jgi:hypothetical protein